MIKMHICLKTFQHSKFLFLREGDTQDDLGPAKRRVEEIVLQIEGGGGDARTPIPIQTNTLLSESRSEEGGGGGGRNVRRLVGRFGEQSRITLYFGREEEGGENVQNLGMERGPQRQAGLNRKAGNDTEGSEGSEWKKGCW